MKRLLAYLFIVLGLGLVFSVNAYSAFCKYEPAKYFSGSIELSKPNAPCPNHWSGANYSEISAYEFITQKLDYKKLLGINVTKITETALINSINSLYAEFIYYEIDHKIINEVVLKIPQLARYKPFLKSSKKQTHIAKKEPSQTQEVAEKEKKIDFICISQNKDNDKEWVKHNDDEYISQVFYKNNLLNLQKNKNCAYKIIPLYPLHKKVFNAINSKNFGKKVLMDGSWGPTKIFKKSEFHKLWGGDKEIKIAKKEPSQTQEVAFNSDIVTATGEYTHAGSKTKNEACQIARERAKQKAIDQVLVKIITTNKSFFNENNKFSRLNYEKFLLENNISAIKFENRLKKSSTEISSVKILYVENSVKDHLHICEVKISAKILYGMPGCIEGNCKNGQGTFAWINGRKYVGEWKDGTYHGQGTFTSPNGDKYVGEFKNGNRHGQGTYTFADGRKAIGIWENGEFVKGDKTQIAKKEPTVTPEEKRVEVAETTQEEFKPEDKDIDNDAPVIEIAETITVNDSDYEFEGKVTDKSKQIFIEVDGRLVDVKKGKFTVTGYSPVDKEISIEAIDGYGNRSKPKIVKLIIDIKDTDIAEKLEPLNPSKIRSKSSSNKVALIIGIENYTEAPKANYANLDAKYFYDYARKAFGAKKQNIKLLINEEATFVKTSKALTLWLRTKVKADQTDLIIFFAGHGLASSDGKELYLLPQDSDPNLLDITALSRTKLFQTIVDLKPKSVTMFLDTCYSGVSRDEQMLLASARPIRIVADEQEGIPDNFTIFSATEIDQISSGLKEAKHGIFSYYLMKGLEGKADSNKDYKITNGELLAYMDLNVSQKASELGREQNPSLSGDPDQVLMSYR